MNKKRIFAAMMSIILLVNLSGCAQSDSLDADPKTSSSKSDNDSKSENKSDNEFDNKSNSELDNESDIENTDDMNSTTSSENTNNSSNNWLKDWLGTLFDTSSDTSEGETGDTASSETTNNIVENLFDKLFSTSPDTSEDDAEFDNTINEPIIDIDQRNAIYKELQQTVIDTYFHRINLNGEPYSAENDREWIYIINDHYITYNELKALTPNMDELWYKMTYVLIRSEVYDYSNGIKTRYGSVNFDLDVEKAHAPRIRSLIYEIDKESIGEWFQIDTDKLVNFSIWAVSDRWIEEQRTKIGILEAESEMAAAETVEILKNIGSQPEYNRTIVEQKGTTVYFAIYNDDWVTMLDPTPFFEEIV